MRKQKIRVIADPYLLFFLLFLINLMINAIIAIHTIISLNSTMNADPPTVMMNNANNASVINITARIVNNTIINHSFHKGMCIFRVQKEK